MNLKKKMVKNIVIGMISILNLSSVLSAEAAKCTARKVHIYYINGVGTPEEEKVKATKVKISDAVKTGYRDEVLGKTRERGELIHPLYDDRDANISYGHIHNRSLKIPFVNYIFDVLESADQRNYLRQMSDKYKMEIVMREAIGKNPERAAWKGLNEQRVKDEMDLQGINLLDAYGSLLSMKYSIVNFREIDVKNLVADLKKPLEDGHKVVLVAHSQGNLFANEAVIELFGNMKDNGFTNENQEFKDKFSVLHVASPWNGSFAKRFESILLLEDLYIDGVVGTIVDSTVKGNYTLTNNPLVEIEYEISNLYKVNEDIVEYGTSTFWS